IISFFFQAEDGIRDFHVTGVQTCALPIWLTSNGLGWGGQVGAIEEFARERFVEVWGDPERRERLVEQTSRAFGVSLRVSDAQGRSEERRVGKEDEAKVLSNTEK